MNKSRPRASIGMPVYNGEKYIEQAINSILAQTYLDFELIISDNASTDRTSEICREYSVQDKRVHYVRNPKNLGAAPNYNRAFELSSGEYFKWADYDDLIAPDFISKSVEVLDQNPDIVLCFPLVRVIDENGIVLGDYEYKSDTSSPDPLIRFRNLLLRPDTAYEVSGLIRSSAIQKTALHGSFPASDLVFLAELALQGGFYKIPEPLFFPRYHAEQSWQVIPVERNRVSFFDTSYQGKITLPKWQYLFAYLGAIRRAPINFEQRAYCYACLVRWIFIPDHFRALGKDVLIAANQLLAQALLGSRSKAKQISDDPKSGVIT
jgi:glycosyltransferase involved in cell wall biosynthesis